MPNPPKKSLYEMLMDLAYKYGLKDYGAESPRALPSPTPSPSPTPTPDISEFMQLFDENDAAANQAVQQAVDPQRMAEELMNRNKKITTGVGGWSRQ